MRYQHLNLFLKDLNKLVVAKKDFALIVAPIIISKILIPTIENDLWEKYSVQVKKTVLELAKALSNAGVTANILDEIMKKEDEPKKSTEKLIKTVFGLQAKILNLQPIVRASLMTKYVPYTLKPLEDAAKTILDYQLLSPEDLYRMNTDAMEALLTTLRVNIDTWNREWGNLTKSQRDKIEKDTGAAIKIQKAWRGYRTRKYLKTIIDILGRSVVARLGVREAERTYKSLMDEVNEAIDEAESRGVEGIARFKQEISVGIDLGSIFTEESDWADYETDNERRAKVIKALTLLHRVVLVKRVRDMISVVSEMFGPDIALKDFVKLKFKLDARMKDFAEQLKNVRVAVGRGYSVEARQAILNEIQAELQQLLIDEQARVAEGQQSIIRTLLSGASGEFRKIAPQIPRIFLTALATQLFFKGLGSLFDWALGELPGRYVRLGELPTYTVPGAPDLPLPSMEQLVSSKVIDGNYLADLLKQFPSASSPASVEWKEADPGVLEAVRSLSEKLAASVRKVAETANFTKLDDNVQKVVNAAVEQKISSKMMMDILRSHINLLAEQKASAAGGKGVPGIVPTPLLLAPKPPAESVMKAGEEGYANFTTYFELYGNASMRSLFQNKMKIGFGLASLIFPVAAGSLGIGAVGTIGARLLSAGVRGAVVGGMEGGPGGAAIGGFAAVGGDLFNQAVGGAAAATLNGIGVFEYLGHVRYLVKNFDSVTGARGLAQTMLRVLEAASPYLGDRQIGWANEAIGLLRGALGLQA